MNAGLHPVMLAAIVGLLLAVLAGCAACVLRGKAAKALLMLLTFICLLPGALILVALHPELIDSRFRTYKRFHRDIQMGMTREQVLAVLERHYPADGPRKAPTIMSDTPTNLGFFMNPETSREPNCEGIFLKLTGGKVINIDYSPD